LKARRIKTAIFAKNFQMYENNSSLHCGNPEQMEKSASKCHYRLIVADVRDMLATVSQPQYVVTETIHSVHVSTHA
jgi:hypothetical protein